MTARAVPPNPPADCALCPRLAAYRAANAAAQPEWHNAPVPNFGPASARLLVVGLAPGLKGANRTGRPFTGDFAGDLLYETLLDFGFADGRYAARADDGLRLVDARIVNAVRCAPPANKPTPAETAACRPFFAAALGEMTRLAAVLCLGRIAHEQTLRAVGLPLRAAPFAHGAVARIEAGPRPFDLFDSYHCSRYNTNTGRLTRAGFRDVFRAIRDRLGD